jgi:hypothetical protein
MGRGVGINDGQSILMSTSIVYMTFGLLFLQNRWGNGDIAPYLVTGFGNTSESDVEPEMCERKR